MHSTSNVFLKQFYVTNTAARPEAALELMTSIDCGNHFYECMFQFNQLLVKLTAIKLASSGRKLTPFMKLHRLQHPVMEIFFNRNHE